MNQPAFARRVVLTVIACLLALSGLWLWLRPPNWQKVGQLHNLEAHSSESPITVSDEQ